IYGARPAARILLPQGENPAEGFRDLKRKFRLKRSKVGYIETHAASRPGYRIVTYELSKDISALRDHFQKSIAQQFVADTAKHVDQDMETHRLIMASTCWFTSASDT